MTELDDITKGLDGLLNKLAGAQPAEGTQLDDAWVWVQAFADFDYEYAYLVDVRRKSGTKTVSDYLAVFQGYNAKGEHVVRSDWHGKPAIFPKVPDLYAALAWWAEWVRTTRGGEHATG